MTLKMDASPTNVQILEHCLIGQILIDKQIKDKYLHSRLGAMWKPGKGLVVIPVDDNKFQFQFAHPLDVENVLKKKVPGYMTTLTLLSKRYHLVRYQSRS